MPAKLVPEIQQNASTAKELSSQAEHLQSIMVFFKVDGSSTGTTRGSFRNAQGTLRGQSAIVAESSSMVRDS